MTMTRPAQQTFSRPPAASGMVWIPGGAFKMGSEKFYVEERPVHRVSVDGFWIDRYAVTNEEFARFVAETGYLTLAERPPDPALYPGAPPENLVPGSMVFHRTAGPVDLRNYANWWAWTPGASWRQPRGPDSSIEGLERHPVVQVAYEDAEAYCAWAGKALPTEAEWERAARGGLKQAIFTWGNEEFPKGRPMANSWQGRFPWENLLVDGYEYTSPVGTFPPNGYGLHDMAGNVWEWTADWYQARHPDDPGKPCCTPQNPRGGQEEDSYNPHRPEFRIPRKVVKGGSHLCAPNYCFRYRPAARQPQDVDSGMSHLGFRCAVRPDGAAAHDIPEGR
jgi:sulfatase modifying factor 1